MLCRSADALLSLQTSSFAIVSTTLPVWVPAVRRSRHPSEKQQLVAIARDSGSTTLSKSSKRVDILCIVVILALTLGVYAPALFGGRALLPADIVPLMRPWSATAREKFPEFRFAQNQMHGPIFEYYSWRHYARERLHAGEVPLWNPYELGGNVLLANSQSAVLYPPNLLLYIFSLPVGINLVTALHTFLTGCFMFWLLRRHRLGHPAALTGGLVWMFCGLQVVWTEFQTPTAALCWLPAGLLAWELAAQRDDWRRGTFALGAVIALVLLAGHLHFAFYVILAFILYGVWRSALRGKWRSAARPLVALLGALAFGLTLSAATMLPVVEMARMNFRGAQDSYAGSIGLRLPPKNLLTLFVPNLYGNPRDYAAFDSGGEAAGGNAYFGAFDFIEYTTYLGIPALLLAVVAIVNMGVDYGRRWAAKEVDLRTRFTPTLFFGLLALVGLLLALGAPLCALFFYGVPGYRQFNATARALCLFSFGTAALAGFGVQAVVDSLHNGASRKLGVAAGWVAGIIAVIGLVAFPGMALVETEKDPSGRELARLLTDQWYGYEKANLAYFALFLALVSAGVWLLLRRPRTAWWASWTLPAVAVADLLLWGRGFNPITDPRMLGYPTQTTDALKTSPPDRVVSLEAPGKGIKSFIVPNYNAVVHLRDVQGADSLHTLRFHQMLEQVVLASEPGRTDAFADPNTLHVPNVNHNFFNLMNVRFVTTDPDVQLGPPFRKLEDAELSIWENPKAFGPAWIVGGSDIGVSGASPAVKLIGDLRNDMRNTVLVDAPLHIPIGQSTGTARVTFFSPHRIRYDVTQTGNGLLITSEIYFPGWRARVDGKPSPVINADWILRATPVAVGHHTAEFSYEPASYRLGLYLSGVGSGAFAWFLTSRRRRFRPT